MDDDDYSLNPRSGYDKYILSVLSQRDSFGMILSKKNI
jgi:hypothetical protein